MQRYLDQARRDYDGTPDATATVITPDCGETIVMVRMQHQGRAYVLAWIGAEYAESPDEFDIDDLPAKWQPKEWEVVK